jgi:hypothetical protein
MWYIGETITSKSNTFKKIVKNSFYEKMFFGKKTIVFWDKVNKLVHGFMIAP